MVVGVISGACFHSVFLYPDRGQVFLVRSKAVLRTRNIAYRQCLLQTLQVFAEPAFGPGQRWVGAGYRVLANIPERRLSAPDY